MSSDNPFSSGPAKPVSGSGASEPAFPAVEQPPGAPLSRSEDGKAAGPGRSAVNGRPVGKGGEGGLPPLEMEETSCRTCEFYHFEGSDRSASSEGECRYNAPNPGFDERARWPIVDWNAWCGQWNTGISDDDMVKMARVVADRMSESGSLTREE